MTIRTPKQQWKALIEDTPTHLSIYTSDGSIIVERFEWQHLTSQTQLPNSQLTAPMPATVVAILKTKGEVITMGERLMVLEAMKMEHTILSPKAGVITDIFYDIGAQVHEGATLLAIE